MAEDATESGIRKAPQISKSRPLNNGRLFPYVTCLDAGGVNATVMGPRETPTGARIQKIRYQKWKK
jgi:hypothetical protein